MRTLVGVLAAGTFLVGLAGAASAADDEGPNFTFGASTSFVYDFNDPDEEDSDALGGGANPLSYANQEAADEAFNIDMVQLGVNGSRGRASYGAKLDWGDLTPLLGDDSDGDIALQTAFLSYDFDGAAFTAGRWDTPIGYEVIEPWGNANISRSYTWTLLQPYNHDGAFVSGSVDVVDAMIGLVNGFTVNESATGLNDIDDEKGIVGAVGAGLSDALNLYFSMIYTEDGDVVDRQLYNAIISGNVAMNGSGMRYALEGNYRNDDKDESNDATEFEGEAEHWSIVGYAGMDFGPTSLDVRGEYMDIDVQSDGSGAPLAFIADLDPSGNGFAGDFDDQVWSVTVTAGWYLTDGLQFRLEYRHDDAKETDPFADDDGAEDTLDTLQAQMVWYPEL